MDPIIKEFEDDLERISSQVELIEALRKFAGCDVSTVGDQSGSHFLDESKSLHTLLKNTHGNLPIASGTLILYTCGRFEAMTRTLFEDLCQRLVAKAGEFSRLPKKMRENLPIFTAKIISDPRKYGHAEGGVRTFVTTLASNLTPNSKIDRVNHECLSITDANMRAEILAELFARVGAPPIWPQISEQAAVKAFFQESDAGSVEAKAKKRLNDLMDLRNKIAHPSGSIDWPSTESLREHVFFLKLLARSMSELVAVYEVTLCKPEPSTQRVGCAGVRSASIPN
jgi:hypothetical protein